MPIKRHVLVLINYIAVQAVGQFTWILMFERGDGFIAKKRTGE